MEKLFSELINLLRFIIAVFGFSINPNDYSPKDCDFGSKSVKMRDQFWLYSNCLTLTTSAKSPPDEVNMRSIVKALSLCVISFLSYWYEYLFACDTERIVPGQIYAIRDCPTLLGSSHRYPVFKSCLQDCETNVGEFILKGPFCHYLKKVNDLYVVDLAFLKEYRVKSNVHKLGCKVSFKEHEGKLVPVENLSETDRKILICSMNNHSSLVRHTSAIHFAFSEDFARKSRKYLNKNSCLFKMLWPHFYGAAYTNKASNVNTLSSKGDYENIFSFNLDEMSRLISESCLAQKLDDYDPDLLLINLPKRSHNYPEIKNRLALHSAIKKYVEEKLGNMDILCYKTWFEKLLIVRSSELEFNSSNLKRLCSVFIYSVMVEHEIIGAGMWDYQTWCDHIYPYVPLCGKKITKNTQRLIYGYIHTLCVKRHKLMDENTTLKKYIRESVSDLKKDHSILQILACDLCASASL